jgi:hypothetical protein
MEIASADIEKVSLKTPRARVQFQNNWEKNSSTILGVPFRTLGLKSARSLRNNAKVLCIYYLNLLNLSAIPE